MAGAGGAATGVDRAVGLASGAMKYLPRVIEVQVTGPHRLRLRFDDGNSGEVDFADRRWRGVFEPLADPAYFARVRLEPGAETISWPNGADIAPETLYERAIGYAVPGAA